MTRPSSGGFTLIELVVVVALVGVVLALAAPSFYDYILRQRLKSVHAQLATDLALARSLATSTGGFGRIQFGGDAGDPDEAADGYSCYTVYTVRPGAGHEAIGCDCTLGAGSACSTGATEAHTVTVPRSLGVDIEALEPEGEKRFGFDPVDGIVWHIPLDPTGWLRLADGFEIRTALLSGAALRGRVGASGRLSTCASADGLGVARC